MEKLQVALNKARKRRGTDTDVSGSAVEKLDASQQAKKALQGSAEMGEVSQLWKSLPLIKSDAGRLEGHRVTSLNASQAAMPFDVLRTKLVLQMRRNNWNRVAITSPSSSCGKTTVACNLALGLGRQTDIRSVLFDMDLRRPNVARLFGHHPDYEIGKLLDGGVPFAEQAVRICNNVAVSMARRPVADPTGLLLHEQTVDVLDWIEASYQPDIMLFDLPPLLVGDDTRAFLKNVDCALIIAKAEQTTANQIDLCEKEIGEHTNVLGVVLNQCRHVNPDEEYGEYY